MVTFDLFDLVMKWKKIYITIWLSKLSILSHGYRVRSKLARVSMKKPIQQHSVCLHTVSTEKRILLFRSNEVCTIVYIRKLIKKSTKV